MKRIMAFIIVWILASTLLASCRTGAEASTEALPAQEARITTLTGYLIGSPPAGLGDVLRELNRKLAQRLQARLELKYIQWGDLSTQYPLVLSSEENVDFVFTGNWAYYAQEAAKGSFLQLTEDRIAKNMPLHYAATDPRAWREAAIGGKIYMIPSATPDQKVPVTLIRGDLRKQYGVAPIRRFNDLEPYLAAVKQHLPGMTPIRVDKQYDFSKTHANLLWEIGPATVDVVFTTNGFSGVFADWNDTSGRLLSVFEEPLRTPFLEAARIVKHWYDSGYINQDAFANKTRSKDSFEQGLSAVAYGNSNDIQSTLAVAAQKGWEVEIIPNLSVPGTYIMDTYINNGVAIAAESKHPDLAMRVLDLIMEDPAYNRLVYYGIEGKNYVLDHGEIALPPGVTAETNDYPPDAAGFWFTNKRDYPPLQSWGEAYRAHKQAVPGMLVPYQYSAFNFDAAPIGGEMEQLNQAAIRYVNPLLSGMVDDVDQAFDRMEVEMKRAGYDRVYQEAQRQTEAYLRR